MTYTYVTYTYINNYIYIYIFGVYTIQGEMELYPHAPYDALSSYQYTPQGQHGWTPSSSVGAFCAELTKPFFLHSPRPRTVVAWRFLRTKKKQQTNEWEKSSPLHQEESAARVTVLVLDLSEPLVSGIPRISNLHLGNTQPRSGYTRDTPGQNLTCTKLTHCRKY